MPASNRDSLAKCSWMPLALAALSVLAGSCVAADNADTATEKKGTDAITDSNPCSTHHDCTSCTLAASCGWCGTSSGGTCLQTNDATGASVCHGHPWAWLSTECGGSSSNPCASFHDCASCTEAASCGWCGSATGGTCEYTTDASGASVCRGAPWAWLSSECGGGTTTNACSQYHDCSSCTLASSCGWCATGSGGSCIQTSDSSGASVCGGGNWSWYSSQCTATTWPNSTSSANSDPWLVAHHDQITQMSPRVLVLNFVDVHDLHLAASNTVHSIANALNEASRYHGYSNASAPAFLQYQIVRVVDLTDNDSPPAGWNHLNSSYYPIKCLAGAAYQFDYTALFSQRFANFYGFADPNNPSHNLTLSELVNRGMINEVWLYVDGNPDPYTCSNGVHMNDFQLPEVAGSTLRHDASGNPLTGQFYDCQNGCLDASDVAAFHNVGRTLHMLYVNATRGPGCAVHSLGHAIEWNANDPNTLPYLHANFQHFGNFDFDRRFHTPFNSWYGIHSVSYPNQNEAVWTMTDGQSGTMNPLNQGCGNVHFPPNARNDYDDGNGTAVRTTCEHFGLHDGPGGTDQTDVYTDAKAQQYNAIANDCEGGWNVYWRQNFPGFDNHATGADGHPMHNWWPYLYY